jgi:hypothetical protein
MLKAQKALADKTTPEKAVCNFISIHRPNKEQVAKPSSPVVAKKASVEAILHVEEPQQDTKQGEFQRQMEREQSLFQPLEEADYYINFPAIQEYLRWQKLQNNDEDVDDEYEMLTARLELAKGLWSASSYCSSHVCPAEDDDEGLLPPPKPPVPKLVLEESADALWSVVRTL